MNMLSYQSINVSILKQVLEKTINAVVITDSQGITKWVNKGFERITGYRSEEVVGKKPGDGVQGKGSDPKVIQKMRDAIKKIEPFEVTILNYTKQGKEYWNYIECMPLYEKDEHTGYLAIQTDVTSRIEFQNQLINANKRAQENYERLLLAFSGGRVGSWDWNPATDDIYFHESWENLVGASLGELKHKLETWKQRIHPEDIDSFKNQLKLVTTNQQNHFISEHRLLCDNNQYRWTMARGQVVDRNVTGTPTRMVGVHLDISEQKRTQQLLDEQNDLLHTILEVIPFAVSWKDGNSCYLGCNNLFLKFWDFSSPRDVIGKTDHELVIRDYTPERIIAEDKQVIESGEPLMHKIENRVGRNGNPLFFDTSKVPLKLHNNEVGILTISIDITELELARESLRQNDLKNRHRGRMEAVGELAGGIAHEFNNLLQAIGGFVSFATNDISPDTQAHADLSQSMKAIRRASQLTDKLLSFSRMEEIEKHECDPSVILEDLRVLLRPLLPVNINVEYEFENNLPPILANPLVLSQALLNLCINSRDAMPTGGNITIGNRLITSHTDAWISFYVTDDGTGIPEYIQDRIFDPFFTTKEVGYGTGLGLSMVYSTAQEHGGSVGFNSRMNKGSHFEIMIPVFKEVTQRNIDQMGDRFEQKKLNKKTILLAEDDATVIQVTYRMLENLGYQILTANNGLEAIEIFGQKREIIHCLVFDISMPLMSGTEAYDEIIRMGSPPPVVFCTGHDYGQDLNTTLTENGYQVIPKPFDQIFLQEAIKKATNSTVARNTTPLKQLEVT